MKEIDARQLECPRPVMLVKDHIEKENPESFTVMVSGETPRENVSRFAESRGYSVECVPEAGGYRLRLSKNASAPAPSGSPLHARDAGGAVVLFISSNKFGEGDGDLGKALMETFVDILGELSTPPETIILANSGVHLAVEGSAVLDALKDLEDKGVKILSCGTCLQHYGVKEKLRCGTVSNMYAIAETLFGAARIVKL